MSGKISSDAEGEGAAISAARVLLWGLVSAVGVFAALLVLMHLPSVQGVVIDSVIKRLEESSGLTIMATGYAWQPFSRLDVEGLSVRTGDSQVLECDRARVAYSFWPLPPFVRVRELILEQPVFHVDRDDRGRWQIRSPERPRRKPGETPAGDGLPWDGVSQFQIRVTGGTVLGRTNGHHVLTIRNISGSLPFRMEPGEHGPRIKLDLGQWHKDF